MERIRRWSRTRAATANAGFDCFDAPDEPGPMRFDFTWLEDFLALAASVRASAGKLSTQIVGYGRAASGDRHVAEGWHPPRALSINTECRPPPYPC